MYLYCIPVLFVAVAILVPIHMQYSKEEFNWEIGIVQRVAVGSSIRLTKIVDVTCTKNDCPKMYATVKAANAIGQASDRGQVSFITTRLRPRMVALLHYGLKERMHISEALFVESDNCFCLGNITYSWVPSSNSSSNCIAGTRVCEKVYLIPLNITHQTESLQIYIESGMIDFYIPRKSIKFYIGKQSFRRSRIFSFNNISGRNLLSALPANLTEIKKIQDESGLWVMPIGNYVIISVNEMETTTIATLTLARYFSELCSTWQTEVRDILNLPDRVLIASKYGLVEYMLDENYLPPRLLMRECITTIDAISQSLASNFSVMALSNDSFTLYRGIFNKGSPLSMTRTLDSTNRTICQALNFAGCHVISFALSSSHPTSVLILVQARNLLVVEYSWLSRTFTIRQNLTLYSDIMTNTTSSNRSSTPDFVGMSFTKLYASYLFVWGNALLYSPNAGLDMTSAMDLTNDVINLFDTSQNGYFVFVTRLRRIYLGLIGSSLVRQLKSLNMERVLTVFFDATTDLYQLSRPRLNCSLSKCVERTRIPLKETLALENIHRNLIHSQRCCSNVHKEKCQDTVLSCSSNPVYQNYSERTCPFHRIRLHPFNFLRFSRVALSVHCNNRRISNHVTALANISTTIFKEENITADSEVLRNCLWVDPSHYSHLFPRSISLDRGSCFNFTAFVHLNRSSSFDFHNFVDTLQLSMAGLKSKNLIVQFQRFIYYEQEAVAFQVKFCDSGISRKKQLPGAGHEMISLDIKIIGSGLDCLSRSFDDSLDIQGYFTTKVLLGCPAGQQVSFDSSATKKLQRKYECRKDLAVPCFHFERVFSPLFYLFDEATLKREIFPGDYTLTIVAGGRSKTKIRNFNEREQLIYNFQKGASLIWSPTKKYAKKPIFTRNNSSFRWLCSSNSPCAGVAPIFPDPPVYYLVIRFSNGVSKKSNCNFTFDFMIRLEGITPGVINPGLIIVLASIAVMIIAVLGGFCARKNATDAFADISRKDTREDLLETLTISSYSASSHGMDLSSEYSYAKSI